MLPGLIILRWHAGFVFFRFLGDQVKTFLDYTDEGSKFVFGDQYLAHRMAFKVENGMKIIKRISRESGDGGGRSVKKVMNFLFGV